MRTYSGSFLTIHSRNHPLKCIMCIEPNLLGIGTGTRKKPTHYSVHTYPLPTAHPLSGFQQVAHVVQISKGPDRSLGSESRGRNCDVYLAVPVFQLG